MNTRIQNRPLLLILIAIGVACMQAPAISASQQATAAAAIPLSKGEFDAAVVEARRRMRHEDPVGQPWYSLDRDKLARLLQMPEFVALDDRTKAPFIDQAGAWELMPFSRPSEAQAMWARWYPERGIDKLVGPNDRTVEPPRVFYADDKWAPEAGAMIALFRCLPAVAWRVHHEEPMLWAREHNTNWDMPNTNNFGMCVRKQREDGRSPHTTSPDTRRGKASAAVLEKKLSEYLLNYRCSGKGPDSCLTLLYALQSLNPQHDKLVPILKALELEFALAEEVRVPDEFKNRQGRLTDVELNAIKAQLRIAVRKTIFLHAKLTVLIQEPSAWPAGELENTLRILLKLTSTTQWAAAVQQVRFLGLGERPFAGSWWGEGTAPALAQVLTKLGREYAEPFGCDVVESHVYDMPPQFWFAYALEKLQREQTSCKALSSYTEVAKLYATATKQKKPQLLEPIAELRKFLDKEGPARDDVVSALGVYCPKTKAAARHDPWNICGMAFAALADAERKQKASAPQAVVEPGKCAERLEMEVAAKLDYVEDQAHRAACRLMPSDRNKSIVALSFIRADPARTAGNDDEMGEYDLDVLIVQSGTGQPLSRLHLDKAYASDAWRFSDIAIDTGRYDLAPRVRAFGVRARHSGSSRANPGSETMLNLYIQEGKRIRQVLSGLVVAKSSGEWDTQCAGHFSETRRAIKIGTATNKGFADLIVTSTTIDTENRPFKDECKSVTQKPRIARFTLRYDGKAYVVPSQLRELQ